MRNLVYGLFIRFLLTCSLTSQAELMGKNASAMAGRMTGNKPRLAVIAICSAVVLMLGGWFPGDETLRRDAGSFPSSPCPSIPTSASLSPHPHALAPTRRHTACPAVALPPAHDPSPHTHRTLSETPLRLMLSRSGFSLGTFYQHGPVKKPPKSEGVWKGPLPRFVRLRTQSSPHGRSRSLPGSPANASRGGLLGVCCRVAHAPDPPPPPRTALRYSQESPMNFTAARDGPSPDCLLVVRDDRPGLVRPRGRLASHRAPCPPVLPPCLATNRRDGMGPPFCREELITTNILSHFVSRVRVRFRVRRSWWTAERSAPSTCRTHPRPPTGTH